MAERVPPPVGLTLVACEHHILDGRTSQHTLIAMFLSIAVERFPATMPRMSVFAELTNGRGTMPIQLRMIDAEEKRPPVINLNVGIEFRDPLDVNQIGFTATNTTFPEPGEYKLQMLHEGRLIIERRIRVMQAPQQQQQQPGAGGTPGGTPGTPPPGANPGWFGS